MEKLRITFCCKSLNILLLQHRYNIVGRRHIMENFVIVSLYPELSLPPQPVLRRWGTWISAALYYASNLEQMMNIVNSIPDEDATKQLNIPNDLAFIAAHFFKNS